MVYAEEGRNRQRGNTRFRLMERGPRSHRSRKQSKWAQGQGNTKESAEGGRLKQAAEGEHSVVGSVVGAIATVIIVATTGSVGHR